MDDQRKPPGKLYTVAKATYLLTQGAVMPLALYYLFTQQQAYIDRGLMVIGIYLVCPFYSILFVALGTYHFPLRTSTAMQVIAAMAVQCTLVALFGGTVLYSFYQNPPEYPAL